MSDDAVSVWREKLDFLETELALTSDAAKRFNLRESIVEARNKITELTLQSATCVVLIDNEIRATGWLATANGFVATVGSIFEEYSSKKQRLAVRFANDDHKRNAELKHFRYMERDAFDCAVLLVKDIKGLPSPLTVLRVRRPVGTIRLCEFVNRPPRPSVTVGSLDRESGAKRSKKDKTLLQIRTANGECGGTGGGAVFCDAIGSVVAIHSLALNTRTEANTLAAFPLYRVQEDPLFNFLVDCWKTLSDHVKDRWHSWQANEGRAIRIEQLKGHQSQLRNPLLVHFNQSIAASPWHERIREVAERLGRTCDDFPVLRHYASRFASVSGKCLTADYQSLHTILKNLPIDDFVAELYSLRFQFTSELKQRSSVRSVATAITRDLDKVDELHDLMDELDGQIKKPAFNKAFLCMGSVGAGKTHMLSTLFEENGRDRTKAELLDVESNESPRISIFFVPLERSMLQRGSLQQAILLLVSEISGVTASTLAEFLAMMGENDSTWSFRLVIVVDDFDRWLSEYPDLRDALPRYINELSCFAQVSWLLTLNDSRFDEVCEDAAIWRRFGWTGRNDTLTTVSGWIRLDDYNRAEHLGVTLLATLLDSWQDGHASLPLTIDACDGRLSERITTPLLAWIIFGLITERVLRPGDLASVNHAKIVMRFEEEKARQICESFAVLGVPKSNIRSVVHQFVTVIALVFAGRAQARLGYDAALARIAKLAETKAPCLSTRKVIHGACEYLKDIGLLGTTQTRATDEGWDVDASLELRTELYWQYYLAKVLMQDIAFKRGKLAASCRRMTDWFCSAHFEYKEGILEMLLLRLDYHTGERNRRFAREFWHQCLAAETIPRAAVWFAGGRASEGMQESLMPLTRQRQPDRRNLFALMYFLSECTVIYTGSERIERMRPFFDDIWAWSLASYFEYVVTRQFQAGDIDEVSRCMEQLWGCEQGEVAETLAGTTVVFIRKKVGEDLSLITERVWRFAKFCSLKDHVTKSGPWGRYFYREWVFHYFVALVAGRKGLHAFQYLSERHWYRAWNYGIHHQIAFEMEREANIAIGRLWWTRESPINMDRRDYVTKLEELATTTDGCLAFHIIRHTRPTRGHRDVMVNKVFRPSLEAIALNPNCKGLILPGRGSYRGMFQLNGVEVTDEKEDRPMRPGQTVYFRRHAFKFRKCGEEDSEIETFDGSPSMILGGDIRGVVRNDRLFYDPEEQRPIG